MSWPRDTFRPPRPGLLLALLLGSPALAARTTPPTDVATLAARSAAVVHGEVIAADTTVDGPDVRTTYVVAPTRTVRGVAPARITVELPGGRVGEAVVSTTGAPVWQVGDDVLVFVEPDGDVPMDGVFTVREDFVVDPFRGADRVQHNTVTALEAAVHEVTEPR